MPTISVVAQSATQAFCPDKYSPLGAVSRASRLAKTRFDPKIPLAATFFSKRLLSRAILGKLLASFIHSDIGSIQPVHFCSRLAVCSSSDFLSLNNFAFSVR
ncbi:hypothetical protein HYZ80_03365 [Candidatus Parcubacteria bacterium]|nr:hypothetical protein [Candidatus Parcubacteria bacterium]